MNEPEIKFSLTNDFSDPIMKIAKGKFYWKGEEVEDVHNVYERMHEFLKMNEANITNSTKKD